MRGSSLAVLLLLGATLSLVPTCGLLAQRSDTSVARTLAPGVSYRKFADRRGPWIVHLVRVDLRRADIALRQARAHDSLRSRERTSAMAQRASTAGIQVLAAVNADFFDLETGENENNQVIGGEWWKGLKVTDSPYDTYDNVHTQLALDSLRHPSMDRFLFVAHAWARGTAIPILTLNAAPTGRYEGTALFTPRYGAMTPRDTTPRDTARHTVEAPLLLAGHRGDTALYVRRGAVSSTSGTAIPRDGAVLSAYGARVAAVQALADGDTVRILLGMTPARRRPALVVGGWPRILRDGRNVAGDAATVEGTISRNAETRHPRTAVGFTRDSATLFLVAVDGRSTTSVGMTLVELAALMRRVGAWQALNFDGGGSTTMVVGGGVVNVPSDSTGERAVGNALLVVRRPAPDATRPGLLSGRSRRSR
jgi:Exopolysaccharide biosynthesis protein related to N-acetylglucosamine-1-phosphodiester alpha-N-acetylglucosaminidase